MNSHSWVKNTVPERRLYYSDRSNNGLLNWIGGNVFFLAVFLPGMPLGRELSPVSPLGALKKNELALSKASTLGIEQTIVVAVVWATIYLVGALYVLKSGQRSFLEAVKRQWPLTLLLLTVPLGLVWTEHSGKVIFNTIHALGIAMVAFANAHYYKNNILGWLKGLSMVMGLAVCIHMVSVILLPDLTVSYDGRWQGLTTNPNTLGGLAFLALWANWARMILNKSIHRINLLFVVISLVVLWGTQSMTSTVASVTALGVMLFMSHRYLWIHVLRAGLALAPLLLLLLYLNWEPVVEEIAVLTGKSSDFSGRFEHWKDAMWLISQHPFLGWGHDSHAQVLRITGLPTVHFHNGYLDLAVRGGWISVILFLLVVVWSIKGLSARAHSLGLILVSFMAAVLVYNVTEVSLLASRNPIWALFLFMALITTLKTYRVCMEPGSKDP